MDGNKCKTKENIHNNNRKLKITWEKKLPTTDTYTAVFLVRVLKLKPK